VDGEEIRGEKEMDDTKYNFGISLTGSAKYQALGGFSKTAFVGISNSSKRQEEAAAFLQFMLDDSVEYGDVNPDFVAETEDK
jgi:ABC-type glycerol-3-phosphate transport system substrate-binding protein